MAELGFGQYMQGYPGGMAPNPNATPEEQEQYRAGWMDVLQRPEVRAGLLQFGLQMMADRPIQQSGLGAFSGALGSGAEAMTANVKAQEAAQQQELENQRAVENQEIQRSQVAAQLAGQASQAATAAAGETAAMSRLKIKIASDLEIAKLPPNEQDMISNLAAKLLQTTEVGDDLATGSDTALDLAKTIVIGARPAPTGTGTEVPSTKVPTTTVPGAGQESMPVPANLKGRSLERNRAMNLFRDAQTGEYFNINGEKVSAPGQ
jgi:hypothetical protein